MINFKVNRKYYRIFQQQIKDRKKKVYKFKKNSKTNKNYKFRKSSYRGR